MDGWNSQTTVRSAPSALLPSVVKTGYSATRLAAPMPARRCIPLSKLRKPMGLNRLNILSFYWNDYLMASLWKIACRGAKPHRHCASKNFYLICRRRSTEGRLCFVKVRFNLTLTDASDRLTGLELYYPEFKIIFVKPNSGAALLCVRDNRMRKHSRFFLHFKK